MFKLDRYTSCESELVTLFRYHGEPHRATFIGKSIWTVMFETHDIIVASYDVRTSRVRYTKTITVHERGASKMLNVNIGKRKIKYATNAVTDSKFGIIAACCNTGALSTEGHDDAGLVLIDKDARIQGVITKGRYCDVKANEKFVVGVDVVKHKVTFHDCQKQHWSRIAEVDLDDECFRIVLFQKTLFLSGPKSRAVLECSLKSWMRRVHAPPGAEHSGGGWLQVSAASSRGCVACTHRPAPSTAAAAGYR